MAGQSSRVSGRHSSRTMGGKCFELLCQIEQYLAFNGVVHIITALFSYEQSRLMQELPML